MGASVVSRARQTLPATRDEQDARPGFTEEGPAFEHATSLRDVVLEQAARNGLIGSEKTERVSARVSRRLLAEAKAKSGIHSDTELVEYALSKVALEDDFGARLLELKGSIPSGIDL